MADAGAAQSGAEPSAGVPPPEVHFGRIAIAVGVGLVCWFAGHGLPFPAGVDPAPACRLLFVTGLTVGCWLLAAMPIAPASLLPLALLPLLGVASTNDVTVAYGDPILWLFGGGFVLAQAVERCGLHRRLALRIVVMLGPRPTRLVLGFFLAATTVSMWINNTAVALLLLPIGTVLVSRTADLGELPPRAMSNFGAAIMCAIAFGATIGGMGSPIGTAPNALFFSVYGDLVAAGARPVSFLQWMLAFAPFALLLCVLSSLVLTRLALPVPRAPLRGGDVLLAEARALPRWRPAERRTAALFGLAVLLWATRGDLPIGDGVVIHGWAHWLVPAGQRDRFIADGSVAVLVAILAFLVPSGDGGGRRLVDWQTVRTMPFDLLLLLGGGIAIAQAFGPTGVSAAFGEVLRPWIGSVPPVLLLFAVVGSVSMLSEVASNTAIATLLLPIVREGAQAASLDPLFLMLPVVIGASCSFMLPIATPPNAIVFASRQIRFGQMAKAGIGLNILSALLLVIVLWWWSMPLLGVDLEAIRRPK